MGGEASRLSCSIYQLNRLCPSNHTIQVSVILGILACMIGTLESVITFFWMRGKYGADF
jgi:hypothetical protein